MAPRARATTSRAMTVERRALSVAALWLWLFGSAAAASSSCDSGWQYLSWQSRCYTLAGATATYYNASTACRGGGGSSGSADLLALKTIANLTTALSLFSRGGAATVVSLLDYVTYPNGTTLDENGAVVTDCSACANVSLAPGRALPACLLAVLASGSATAVVQDTDCSQPHAYMCSKAPTSGATSSTALDVNDKMAIFCLAFILVTYAVVNAYFLLSDFFELHPCKNRVDDAVDDADSPPTREKLNETAACADDAQAHVTPSSKPPLSQPPQPQVPLPQQHLPPPQPSHQQQQPQQLQPQLLQPPPHQLQPLLPPSLTKPSYAQLEQLPVADIGASAAASMDGGDRHGETPSGDYYSDFDGDLALLTDALAAAAAAYEADLARSRVATPRNDLPSGDAETALALPPSRSASSRASRGGGSGNGGADADAEGRTLVSTPTAASMDGGDRRGEMPSTDYGDGADLALLTEAPVAAAAAYEAAPSLSRSATLHNDPPRDDAETALVLPPSRSVSSRASRGGGGGRGNDGAEADAEGRTAVTTPTAASVDGADLALLTEAPVAAAAYETAPSLSRAATPHNDPPSDDAGAALALPPSRSASSRASCGGSAVVDTEGRTADSTSSEQRRPPSQTPLSAPLMAAQRSATMAALQPRTTSYPSGELAASKATPHSASVRRSEAQLP